MQVKWILFLSLLAWSAMLFAQPGVDSKSIHQLEYELHRSLPKQPSLFDSSGRGIIRLAKTGTGQKPSVAVFGYLPDWQYLSTRAFLQYDLLTHIAAFDFTVSASGAISKPSYWPWTDVINAAHAHGVKIILTAVNFNADDIHNLLTNQQAKQNFFSNLKALLNQYNLDGVNIDFEGLYTADRGSLLNGFMADLSASIKNDFPDAEISFAGPAVNWGGWDLKGLAKSCDYVFIMGYAFAGSWSSTTGANAPLSGGSYNITNTVTVQYASVTNENPQKLILGLPYYGHRWKTPGPQAGASTTEFMGSVKFSPAEKEAQNYGRLWHSSSQTPWFCYQIGSQWYQVWFDGARSLALKYDLADSKNLRGVGMWALGYDDGRQELWNLLRQRYLPQSAPQPVAPSAIFVQAGDEIGQLRVEFETVYGAQGYEVYLSTDGQNFTLAKSSSNNQMTLENLALNDLYFLKVRSFNARGSSSFSGVLAATCSRLNPMLLVDGFERNDQNQNTFAYLIQHAKAFWGRGQALASATNEAIVQNICQLDSFKMIDWMCGDESQADFTLNETEKQRIRRYLENGGNFFISGSEIGYDLVEKGSQDDRDFYQNYLKAEYVSDAPLGRKATYYSLEGLAGSIFASLGALEFDNGSYGTYDVDWPDAIRPLGGAQAGLVFSGVDVSNGGAAVYYKGTFGASTRESRLLYLTVPFETIYPLQKRQDLAAAVLNYFSQPLAIDQAADVFPERFRFIKQYPNPFNNRTVFEFELSRSATVELRIFDVLGQQVLELKKALAAGRQRLRWDGRDGRGRNLSGGMYFFQLIIADEGKTLHTGKLILVK